MVKISISRPKTQSNLKQKDRDIQSFLFNIVVNFHNLFIGAGVSYSSGASGGSYGARGGRGSGPHAVMPYGSIYTVGTWGSGGGTSSNGRGGRGGGRFHAEVVTEFQLTGSMRANGDNAVVGIVMKI